MPDLRDLDPQALAAWLQERGHPRYRAEQVLEALHRSGARSIDEMRLLPAPLRKSLAAEFSLGGEEIERRQESADGTVKLLLRLADGERVETVYLPEDDRATLCLSTQAGCRMACAFCRTGAGGFARQLLPSEILAQLSAATRELGPVSNLVFMGMGEPLDNLDHLLAALRVIVHPRAFAMPARRVVVSTIGLVEGIRRLAAEGPGVGLALSLHSALEKTRQKLLPRGRKFDLAELKKSLRDYAQATGRRPTVEVTLIRGVNDSPEEARAVAKFAGGADAKVNLIALNPSPELGLSPPEPEAVAAYRAELRSKGVDVFLRKSRGADILAACGQLRADRERDC